MLLGLGFRDAQGFLFSAAVPLDEAMPVLVERRAS
jgi:EAL domain-containing protein (putative c-di-GMP-specific phosphodiesterase class I)